MYLQLWFFSKCTCITSIELNNPWHTYKMTVIMACYTTLKCYWMQITNNCFMCIKDWFLVFKSSTKYSILRFFFNGDWICTVVYGQGVVEIKKKTSNSKFYPILQPNMELQIILQFPVIVQGNIILPWYKCLLKIHTTKRNQK